MITAREAIQQSRHMRAILDADRTEAQSKEDDENAKSKKVEQLVILNTMREKVEYAIQAAIHRGDTSCRVYCNGPEWIEAIAPELYLNGYDTKVDELTDWDSQVLTINWNWNP